MAVCRVIQSLVLLTFLQPSQLQSTSNVAHTSGNAKLFFLLLYSSDFAYVSENVGFVVDTTAGVTDVFVNI